MRNFLLLTVMSFFACTAVWPAFTPGYTFAASNKDIGVVLLHGQIRVDKWIKPLVQEFRSAGVRLATPEMTWSDTREYDVSFDVSMAEIHAAVQALRKSGATKIFVGGHMMGGSAAAAYGAEHHDIAGVLLISPAHTIEMEGFTEQNAKNVAFAKKQIGAGHGDQVFDFPDYACRDLFQGKVKRLQSINQKGWAYSTTPVIYLSHYDSGPIDRMPENVKMLGRDTSLLWVVDTKGLWAQEDNGKIFASAPENPHNEYLIVPSNHFDIPRDVKKEIVEWVLATGFAK